MKAQVSATDKDFKLHYTYQIQIFSNHSISQRFLMIRTRPQPTAWTWSTTACHLKPGDVTDSGQCAGVLSYPSAMEEISVATTFRGREPWKRELQIPDFHVPSICSAVFEKWTSQKLNLSKDSWIMIECSKTKIAFAKSFKPNSPSETATFYSRNCFFFILLFCFILRPDDRSYMSKRDSFWKINFIYWFYLESSNSLLASHFYRVFKK